MITFQPKDEKFKSFKINIEYWDNKPVIVNNDLGIAVRLEENTNVDEKLEEEINTSWHKIVEEYDDSKLIFKKLKKIRNNLIELRNDDSSLKAF
ncbi:MAG TPA: hypothetical protein VN704_06740 [Verrucomicrobiae bacterium]|nr:hypothetical protein [Verrucomicrobiae bacterium]